MDDSDRCITVELAVLAELEGVSDRTRVSTLAATAIALARRLDETTAARDSASLARELRITMSAIHGSDAGDDDDDPVEEFKRRMKVRRAAARAAAADDGAGR